MFGKKSALNRLAEEQLYEAVALEIKNNELREGLWAKALAKAKGDQEQAKGIYIELRVQSLKDELAITGQILKEATKEERRQEEIAKREEKRQEEIAKVAEEERAKKIAHQKQQRARKLARRLDSFEGVKLDALSGGGWEITHNRNVVMTCDSLDEIEQFIALWTSKLEQEKSEKKSSRKSLNKGPLIFIVVLAVMLWLLLG